MALPVLALLVLAAPQPAPIVEDAAPRQGRVTWRSVELSMPDAPRDRLYARVERAEVEGAEVPPYAELVGEDRGRARVRYPVAVPAGARKVSARVRVALYAIGQRAPLVEKADRWETAVEPALARPLDALDADAWNVRAETAAADLPYDRARLRTDAPVALPPPRQMRLAHLEGLSTLARARLEAWAARFELRARAQAGETAALRALAKQAKATERAGEACVDATLAACLAGAEAALERLELVEARARATSARRRPAPYPTELARLLRVEGALAWLAGEESVHLAAFGQARALDPEGAPSFQLPPLEGRPLEPSFGGPAEPLELEVTAALRTAKEDGLAIEVFGNVVRDPFRLVQRLRVEWIGSASSVRGATESTLLDDGTFQARIPADSLGGVDSAFLRIEAKDRSGHVVRTLGDPDPVRVELSDGEGVGGFELPSWVWWVAGGVAVAGGLAAGIAVASGEEEVRRGIGPVTVEF